MTDIKKQFEEYYNNLWNKTEPKLRRICNAKMHGYDNEIDDVLSETYLAFFEYTSKHGLPENITAWLYSVLNKRINNKFREIYKSKKRKAYYDDIEVLSYEVDFDEELYKKIPIEKLKEELLSSLSKEEFELYKYIYEYNLNYSEAGIKLGITNSAVKQRHYRLCNKIKKLAKKVCYENKF